VVLVSPPGPYIEKFEALDFRCMLAPMKRRSLNPFRELALVAWLWRLIRREQADVVHSFTIKCVVYGGLIARFAGAASINSVAGMGYVFARDMLKARVLRPVVRGLLRAALRDKRARLILQNPDDVRYFARTGIVSRERIRLIRGTGVNCSNFVPRDDEQATVKGPMKVLLAARLLWDKGVGEFVEAARVLQAEKRPVQFYLAGAPDPVNPTAVPEKTIWAWQAEGLVHWLGHVTDMPALLAGADIVVLPSYYGEGLPKILLEAAACARPLITTDMPGCREAVTDGVNGLLVPAQDAMALARAIACLQDDPARARSLGQAAREKVLAEFDQDIVSAQTLEVYDEIVV